MLGYNGAVRLTRIQLHNFRNFHHLDISFPPGPSLVVGDNAQGKTNLLEAIYLLSALRPFRAETEAQLIHREAIASGLSMARVTGEVMRAQGPLRLEVVVGMRQNALGGHVTKVVKVNGVARRAQEAVGLFSVVPFSVQDLELISGSPALRRRYLDSLLGRIDARYLMARQRLEKVLLQRNHLLRRLRERAAHPDELDFWDETLAQEAAYIVWARAQAVQALSPLAAAAHEILGDGEEISIVYLPRLGPEATDALSHGPEALAQAFLLDLQRMRPQEVAAGMTLLGPQRDDLRILLEGMEAAGYASRAQERTLALSLRLAEAHYLHQVRGDPPVLLLDDVMSELDARRRRRLLEPLLQHEQVILTGTEAEAFPRDLVATASLYTVTQGVVTPVSRASTTEP